MSSLEAAVGMLSSRSSSMIAPSYLSSYATGNPGPSAVGGLIRDSQCQWIQGYSSFIGFGTALKAEIWTIISGFKLAKSLNYDHILVESDSMLAINLIKKDDVHPNHHLNNLLLYCRSTLLTFTEVQLSHTSREGNSCADLLAKTALMDRSCMKTFHSVPSFVRMAFLADLHGISFDRKVPTAAVI
ncbi:putative ribonuclease H-like domain-containing protein [Senna tora]|uniref:Putative ribonuclease H-like domain-containing protein n=1 Tax=Senna tora TaxID=362788 RepID=A0A834WAL6_9FABA|nr:putative ribonuclease H-like domain-containing protein [Senna tora]